MVVTSGGEFHSIPKDIVTSVINAPRVCGVKSPIKRLPKSSPTKKKNERNYPPLTTNSIQFTTYKGKSYSIGSLKEINLVKRVVVVGGWVGWSVGRLVGDIYRIRHLTEIRDIIFKTPKRQKKKKINTSNNLLYNENF